MNKECVCPIVMYFRMVIIYQEVNIIMDVARVRNDTSGM